MGLFEKYYDKVAIQRENFEKMLAFIQETESIEEKLDTAVLALKYAVERNTGYFTSSVLEKVFTDYAKSLKINLNNITYQSNSFLHILTQGYDYGGHTRVVERWIENAPLTQVHSVVIIDPNDYRLDTLKKECKRKNGEFVLFRDQLNLKERALKLREIGMHYEYVILHIHMEDPSAVVAFGTDDFIRPVLFYNHASHLFWIGKSITDLLLDLSAGDEQTKQRRKIFNIYSLGIPSKSIQFLDEDKSISRKKLNFPLDKKIIVTAGHNSKFRFIDNENLLDLIKEIIDDNSLCYAIGVMPSDRAWDKAKKESNGKIIPLGIINFDDGYMDYIKSADLYLDSYPFPGGTATIDAISVGTPVISLKAVFLQLDYLTQTRGYCSTKEEFIKKGQKILNDKNFAQEILDEERKSLVKYQSKEVWNEKIKKILEITPKRHRVQNFTNEKDYCEISDICVLNNVLFDKDFCEKITPSISKYDIKYGFIYKKIRIINILNIEKRQKGLVRTKIIQLFNIPLFKWSKKPKIIKN